MKVLKRSGQYEEVSLDKVLKRIKLLCDDLTIDPVVLAQKVCMRIYDKISTKELDEFAASLSSSMITENIDYDILSTRLLISNLHKNTESDYLKVVEVMNEYLDPRYTKFVKENINFINSLFDYNKDYNFDYFGFKTMERTYLYNKNGVLIERPQHCLMREAIGIHLNDIDKVIRNELDMSEVYESIRETYEYVSNKYYTHATPTLFNAGTNRPQLSSCFLIQMEDDSIEGIYNTLKECALISKDAGGIGLSSHNIRGKNSKIRGTNGISNGLVPMLKVFNETAQYVDQCVVPDTIIYTSNGPIKIKNCVTNDTKVFNTAGYVEVIQNVLEHNYSGDIIRIKTEHSFNDLLITPEHPVYVIRGNRISYIEAKDLVYSDRIITTIPFYFVDDTTITYDDCSMYGLLCINDTVIGEENSITLKNETENREFILNYFATRYILTTVEYLDNDTKVKITWSKTNLLPFKYSDLFDVNGNKYIQQRWLNLPIQKCQFILKGIIDKTRTQDNNYYIETTSSECINCIRFLCLKLGVLPSKYEPAEFTESFNEDTGETTIINHYTNYNQNNMMIPKTDDITKLMSYTYTTVPTDNNFIFINIHNKFNDTQIMSNMFSKILTQSTETYSGVVYDLQMSTTHNYMLEQGVVHNGGGKRKGSFAVYLEPWHSDIEDFLDLKKARGTEQLRARDLFYALWIPDLFMKRVKNNEMWSLMCPDDCSNLSKKHGYEFDELYIRYEQQQKYRKQVSAQDLWKKILSSCIETGGPYLLFKDHCNNKSNHSHLGTIQSSNLCAEIVQYTSKDETAVCNLASLCLPNFIDKVQMKFDYQLFRLVVHKVVENLSRVIDVNYYPTEKCKMSNQKHRPIGIGVQGLSDLFQELKMSWEENETRVFHKKLFEYLYYCALEKSCMMAEKYGVYSSYENSPIFNGKLQFDMWNIQPTGVDGLCKWDELREKIKKNGVYHSLLIALMPTASTSQIMGFSECMEPQTSNIFVRRTDSGEFKLLNKRLVKSLQKYNLWSKELQDMIIVNDGSVQWIDNFPEKHLFKNIWEFKHRLMVDYAADRGSYIDQSQSFNVYMEEPTISKLSSAYLYSWEKGLKTCQYYLRIKPKAKAISFTIDPNIEKKKRKKKELENTEIPFDKKIGMNSPINFELSREQSMKEEDIEQVCTRDNPNCLSCGS